MKRNKNEDMADIENETTRWNGVGGQEEAQSSGTPESPRTPEDETPQDEAEAPADDVLGEFDVLRAELEQTRDRYLRQAAEFQNFRKRTALERETLLESGKVLVIERMLEVMDDLDRTVGAMVEAERQEDPGAAYQSLRQGVELVHRKLVDELTRLNVTPIEAVGQPFDESLHDAMMQQPAPDGTAPGTIVAEIQKGYRMGDRVLRHSKVVVAQ